MNDKLGEMINNLKNNTANILIESPEWGPPSTLPEHYFLKSVMYEAQISFLKDLAYGAKLKDFTLEVGSDSTVVFTSGLGKPDNRTQFEKNSDLESKAVNDIKKSEANILILMVGTSLGDVGVITPYINAAKKLNIPLIVYFQKEDATFKMSSFENKDELAISFENLRNEVKNKYDTVENIKKLQKSQNEVTSTNKLGM